MLAGLRTPARRRAHRCTTLYASANVDVVLPETSGDADADFRRVASRRKNQGGGGIIFYHLAVERKRQDENADRP